MTLLTPAANIPIATLKGTLADGVNALLTVAALVLGLSLPQHCLRLLLRCKEGLVL